MVQLSATRCICIAILWVRIVNFAACFSMSVYCCKCILDTLSYLLCYTKVYPEVSGLAVWSENYKWYNSLSLGAAFLSSNWRTSNIWSVVDLFRLEIHIDVSQKRFIYVSVYPWSMLVESGCYSVLLSSLIYSLGQSLGETG